MIDTVCFDLDGTLLPMDQEEFVNTYLELLARKLEPHGYEPRHLTAAIWSGTQAMVENDGSRTNEEAFWEDFCHIFGEQARKDLPLFEEFYAADFARARTVCRFAPQAAEVIGLLKEKGVRLVLATNPLYPAIATRQRIRWAGLEPGDFELVTTYENSGFCKPNPEYYRDLLEKLGADAERCLMVGNDVQEDIRPAQALGMEPFLLTPCLINRGETEIGAVHQGGFDDLKEFLLKRL